MFLRDFNTYALCVEADEASGKVVRELSVDAVPDEGLSKGRAHRHRGRWFFFWFPGDGAVLQSEGERWASHMGLTASVDGQIIRTFTIRGPDGVAFRRKYCRPQYLWSRLDPTYDGLDEEMDDFFLYVASSWPKGEGDPPSGERTEQEVTPPRRDGD